MKLHSSYFRHTKLKGEFNDEIFQHTVCEQNFLFNSFKSVNKGIRNHRTKNRYIE